MLNKVKGHVIFGSVSGIGEHSSPSGCYAVSTVTSYGSIERKCWLLQGEAGQGVFA